MNGFDSSDDSDDDSTINQLVQSEFQQNFRVIRKIGEGASGKVYLIENINNLTKRAIKVAPLNYLTSKERNQCKKELINQQKLDHPRIIKIIDGKYDRQKKIMYIVMEYAEGGDLQSRIDRQSKNGQYFEEEQILDWFIQISAGLKYSHQNNIIHRDIKGKNILLNKNNECMIGDFGISKQLDYTNQKLFSVIGTPAYVSPEILKEKGYSFSTDIWSLGILLYQLCCLKPPFEIWKNNHSVDIIQRLPYPPIVRNKYSYGIKTLISKLLRKDQKDRITLDQIFKEPIIQKRLHFCQERHHNNKYIHFFFHFQNCSYFYHISDINQNKKKELPSLDIKKVNNNLQKTPSRNQLRELEIQTQKQNEKKQHFDFQDKNCNLKPSTPQIISKKQDNIFNKNQYSDNNVVSQQQLSMNQVNQQIKQNNNLISQKTIPDIKNINNHEKLNQNKLPTQKSITFSKKNTFYNISEQDFDTSIQDNQQKQPNQTQQNVSFNKKSTFCNISEQEVDTSPQNRIQQDNQSKQPNTRKNTDASNNFKIKTSRDCIPEIKEENNFKSKTLPDEKNRKKWQIVNKQDENQHQIPNNYQKILEDEFQEHKRRWYDTIINNNNNSDTNATHQNPEEQPDQNIMKTDEKQDKAGQISNKQKKLEEQEELQKDIKQLGTPDGEDIINQRKEQNKLLNFKYNLETMTVEKMNNNIQYHQQKSQSNLNKTQNQKLKNPLNKQKIIQRRLTKNKSTKRKINKKLMQNIFYHLFHQDQIFILKKIKKNQVSNINSNHEQKDVLNGIQSAYQEQSKSYFQKPNFVTEAAKNFQIKNTSKSKKNAKENIKQDSPKAKTLNMKIDELQQEQNSEQKHFNFFRTRQSIKDLISLKQQQNNNHHQQQQEHHEVVEDKNDLNKESDKKIDIEFDPDDNLYISELKSQIRDNLPNENNQHNSSSYYVNQCQNQILEELDQEWLLDDNLGIEIYGNNQINLKKEEDL